MSLHGDRGEGVTPNRDEMNQAAMRQSAAQHFHAAKVSELTSVIMVGDQKKVEEARIAAVASFEALIDAIIHTMRLNIRHLRN